MDDITNALLNQLTAWCAECSDGTIDTQFFICYLDSPTHVTYRVRLEGNSETDSGSIISLIEEWVRGGASIIVTGVLMTVDSECSVAISSLSEGECSTTQPPTTNPGTSTPAETLTFSKSTVIISGSIAAIVIVLILAITVAITCMATAALRNRHGDMSTKNAER